MVKRKRERVCVLLGYERGSGKLGFLTYGNPGRSIRTYPPGKVDGRVGPYTEVHPTNHADMIQAIVASGPEQPVVCPVSAVVQWCGVREAGFARPEYAG